LYKILLLLLYTVLHSHTLSPHNCLCDNVPKYLHLPTTSPSSHLIPIKNIPAYPSTYSKTKQNVSSTSCAGRRFLLPAMHPSDMPSTSHPHSQGRWLYRWSNTLLVRLEPLIIIIITIIEEEEVKQSRQKGSYCTEKRCFQDEKDIKENPPPRIKPPPHIPPIPPFFVEIRR
jgi:hypothetical protein